LPDSDILWLTFACTRSYGWVVSGRPQIWVSAIDPLTLEGGEDPSSPPFWLPGQRTSDGNHIPAWGL